jgi:ADP-ribosylglycohydrolase
MTLCLLESLARLGRIDYTDIMSNFVSWMNEAKFTPTGVMFDIGRGTMQALMKFTHGTEPLLCGGGGPYDNGNGSLMRIAPMALYLYEQKGTNLSWEDLSVVHDISKLTHAHARSLMACGIYVLVAVQLLDGSNVPDAIKTGLGMAQRLYGQHDEFAEEMSVYERLWDVQAFEQLPKDTIKSSGYVVDTLEAVLWCLLNTQDYQSCVLTAVNLGEDTDTVGAIAGGLAGLAYGMDSIPAEWQSALLRRDYIANLCDEFGKKVG